MLLLALIVWLLVTLFGAIGLHIADPQKRPVEHFLPAVRTLALIFVAVAYVAIIWSH